MTLSDLYVETSGPHMNPSYETVLKRHASSYMGKYKPGVTEASERLCQTLLDTRLTTYGSTTTRCQTKKVRYTCS